MLEQAQELELELEQARGAPVLAVGQEAESQAVGVRPEHWALARREY